jgi:hypothetical protein
VVLKYISWMERVEGDCSGRQFWLLVPNQKPGGQQVEEVIRGERE